MGHGHHHGHGAHAHPQASATRTFAWVTLINLAYTVVEAGYGFHTNSLALLSDALHNLGDVLGLALAWGAAALAGRPPRGRHTYGWRRATLLSPLANAVLLMVFSGALGWEAFRRFSAPPEIPATPVIVIASLGILVNLGAAWLVKDGHAHDLNKRGAFLHLLADAAVVATLAEAVAAALLHRPGTGPGPLLQLQQLSSLALAQLQLRLSRLGFVVYWLEVFLPAQQSVDLILQL